MATPMSSLQELDRQMITNVQLLQQTIDVVIEQRNTTTYEINEALNSGQLTQNEVELLQAQLTAIGQRLPALVESSRGIYDYLQSIRDANENLSKDQSIQPFIMPVVTQIRLNLSEILHGTITTQQILNDTITDSHISQQMSGPLLEWERSVRAAWELTQQYVFDVEDIAGNKKSSEIRDIIWQDGPPKTFANLAEMIDNQYKSQYPIQIGTISQGPGQPTTILVTLAGTEIGTAQFNNFINNKAIVGTGIDLYSERVLEVINDYAKNQLKMDRIDGNLHVILAGHSQGGMVAEKIYLKNIRRDVNSSGRPEVPFTIDNVINFGGAPIIDVRERGPESDIGRKLTRFAIMHDMIPQVGLFVPTMNPAKEQPARTLGSVIEPLSLMGYQERVEKLQKEQRYIVVHDPREQEILNSVKNPKEFMNARLQIHGLYRDSSTPELTRTLLDAGIKIPQINQQVAYSAFRNVAQNAIPRSR